jgi:anti-anti-sigma regulatory factor
MKTSKRKKEAAPPASAAAAAETPLVSLPATCTLRETADLKARLLRWIDSAEPVVLDASGVQRIDTAALQVLCAFARDRRSRNLAFTWQGRVDTVAEACRLLGIASILGLPEQAGA